MSSDDEPILKVERNELPSTTRALGQVQEYLTNQAPSTPSKLVDEQIHFLFGEMHVFLLSEIVFTQIPAPEFKLPIRTSHESFSNNLGIARDLEKRKSFESEGKSLDLPHSESILRDRTSSDAVQIEVGTPVQRTRHHGSIMSGQGSLEVKVDDSIQRRHSMEKEPSQLLFARRDTKVLKLFDPFNLMRKGEDPVMRESGRFTPEPTGRKLSIGENQPLAPIAPSFMQFKKISILEFLKEKRMNESDLQRIKGFGKDEPEEDDYIVNEGDFKRLMAIHYSSYKYLPVENTLCDRIRLKYSPYPNTSSIEKVIFSFESFSFDTEMVEPLFLKIALYDLKSKKKISEDYELEVNNKEQLSQLDDRLRDELLQKRKKQRYSQPKCLFFVENPSDEIVLLLWVERVFQGDISDVWKTYKENQKSDKIKKKIKEKCDFLGRCRQPFLFGYKNLFYKENDRFEPKEGVVQIGELFRVPDTGSKSLFNIFDAIEDEKGVLSDKNKLDCSFKFSINKASPDKMDQLSVEYIDSKNKIPRDRFKFYQKGSKFNMDERLHEYFDVVAPFPPVVADLTFQNSIYLTPEALNLNSTKFTNIVVKMTYKENDKVFGQEGKRIAMGSEYTGTYFSAMTFGQRLPQFWDEVRVDYPPPLTPMQHIVFEFFHVDTSKPAKEQEEKLGKVGITFAGASFLQFTKAQGTEDKVQHLKVYSKLKDGYLTDSSLAEMKGTSFDCRFTLISSVNPKNKNLQTMYDLVESLHKIVDDKKRAVQSNPKKYYTSAPYIEKFLTDKSKTDFAFSPSPFEGEDPYQEVLQRLPTLLKNLFAVSSNVFHLYPLDVKEGQGELTDEYNAYRDTNRENVKKFANTCFDAIIRIILGSEEKSKQQGRMNTLIGSYIQNYFKNPRGCPQPFFVLLLQIWTEYLGRAEKESPVDRNYIPMFEKERSVKKSVSDVKRKSIERMLIGNGEKGNGYLLPQKLTYAHTFYCSWALFDVIYKSMYMYAKSDHYANDFQKTCVNSAEFKNAFFSFLESYVPKLDYCVKKSSFNAELGIAAKFGNNQLALFMADIIPLLNDPAEYVAKYTSLLTDPTPEQCYFKVCFFEVITDSMNFPLILDKHNVLAREYAQTMIDALTLPDMNPYTGAHESQSHIREKALAVIKHLLTKFDFDSKFVGKGQDFIVQFHTPFLVKALEMGNDIVMLQDDVRVCTDFVTSIFFLLSNMHSDRLSDIMKTQREKAATGLTTILLSGTLVAKYTDHFEGKFRKTFTKILLDTFIKNILNDYLKPAYDDVFGTNPSDNYNLTTFIEIFEKTCKIFSGLGLIEYPLPGFRAKDGNAPQNTVFKNEIFENLYLFIDKFRAAILKIPMFKQSTILSITDINDSRNRSATPWDILLGTVLQNGHVPISMSHDSIAQCIRLLLDMQRKPVIPKETDDKMQKIEPNMDKSNEPEEEGVEIEFDKEGKIIQFATLPKLVERLVMQNPGYPADYYKIFFLTYLSFTDPIELLDHVRKCWKTLLKQDTAGNILASLKETVLLVKVLQHWVKEHYDDMDQAFVTELVGFLNEIGECGAKNLEFKNTLRPVLQALTRELLDVESSAQRTIAKKPDSILPQNFELIQGNKFSFFAFDSLEIARQMTLIDFSIFRGIHHRECFGKKKGWDTGTREMKLANAKYITLSTERCNAMTKWVAALILKENDINERAKLITKLLDICKYLRDMHNFTGLFGIVGAFSLNTIDKLSKTWALCPGKYDEYRSYAELLSPKQNYAVLKDTLKATLPPCIPHMPMYLGALTFIELLDNEKVKNGKTLIHFQKRIQYSLQITSLRLYQQTHYEIEEVPYLTKVLKNGGGYFDEKQLTEDEEWDMYQWIEKGKV